VASIAKIIGTAAIRLTASERGLALSFRNTIRKALDEATVGLGEDSTKGVSDDADKTSRRVKQIFSSMFQSVGKLGSSLLSGVLAGGKLLLLASAAGTALSAVGALSAGVIALVGAAAQAAGAIGILPAVLAGVVAVTATLKLGMKGVGDALKAVGSGDAEALSKALEKLSPNARDFVRSIQGIKPEFDRMQLGVQDALFDGLGSTVQSLAARYLPLASAGFKLLAGEINSTVKNVGAILDSPEAFDRIKASTEGIVVGFSNARQAALPMTQAVLDIVKAGSSQLPRLGDAVNTLATRFADFIRKGAESGSLEAFFSKSLDVASQLGRILGNLGGIIGSVFSAGQAAGGGLLNSLEKLTASAETFLKSVEGQDALGTFFGSIATVGEAAFPVLRELALLIGGDIAPLLSNIAAGVGPGVVAVIGQLRETVTALTPGMSALGEAFGRVLTAVAPILPAIGELIGKIATGLAAGLNAAIGPLTTFINFLANSPGALAGMAAAAGAIGLAVGPLSGIFSTLGPIIGNLVSNLGGLKGVFSLLTGPVGLIIGLLVALFVGSEDFRNAVLGLVSVVGGLVGQLVSALMPAIETIIGAIGPLIAQLGTALAPVITTVANLLSAVLPPIIAALVPVINSLIPIVMQAAQVLGLIVSAVAPIIEMIANALIPIITNLLPVVTTVFNAVAAVITAAMQIVQGIIDVVLGIVTGNWDQAWNGIKNIVNGVVNLIVSIVSGALNIVVSVVSSTFNAAVSLVKSAWNAISSAVSSGVDSVINFFRNLPSNIMSALGSLGSLLASAGRDLINGLINGVKAAAAGIADAVLAPIKNAVAGVKSFLGISSPSKLFAEIGVDTGRGLVVGLERITPAVVAATTDVASSMAGALAVPAANLSLTSLANGAGATGSSTGADGRPLVLQQTNVMQPGSDLERFADAVYRNGLYDLQSAGSLSTVSLGNVQSGMSSPDAIFGVRGV
jgi:phage-related protein